MAIIEMRMHGNKGQMGEYLFYIKSTSLYNFRFINSTVGSYTLFSYLK